MHWIMGRAPAGTGDNKIGGVSGIDARSWKTLALLAVLFLLRVLAQAIQAVAEVAWLPTFDSWQSGAVSYSALLIGQMMILTVQTVLVIRVMTGRFEGRPPVSTILFGLGLVYFAFMLFRLVAGFTLLTGHGWFDAPLPSTFHLVLASFLLALSRAGTTSRENLS